MTDQALINSLEFAQKSLEIHGRIPLRQLTRLQDALSSGAGELQYRLQGYADEEGRPGLRMQVSGQLSLICQRCLGPVDHALDFTVNYLLVADETMLPPACDEDDDADFLVADPQLQVLQLVEDEVLLSLPLAPKHEDEGCAGPPVHETARQETPFGALRGLKQKK